MVKRVLDMLLVLLAWPFVALPLLGLAIAIRIDSPGPAIFRQRRSGRFGRPFMMLKFRTMRTDADPYGVSPHDKDDPRLTRLGKWLRETSLDELPQIWNVMMGQMSLVGPRPLYERQAAEWTDRQRRRLDVRPGMTGYAQVYGRADVTIEDKIEMDLFYVDNQGLALDIKILWKTFADIFTRRGQVYERRYSRLKEKETDKPA